MLANECVPEKVNLVSDPWVVIKLSEVMEERNREIKEAEELCRDWVEGKFFISGYDPMNMIRFGDLILCKHFIRLTDLESKESRVFYEKTVLRMEQGSENLATTNSR